MAAKLNNPQESLIYLPNINKLNMSISAHSFKKLIESSQHIIIPSVSLWPRQLHFPIANELTIINWNRKQLYSWLHPRNFPVAQRINYLCDEQLPFEVQIMFTIENPQFQFHEISCLGLCSQLDNVPWKNIYELGYIEYFKLMKQGTDKKYKSNWENYIKEFRKEHH